MNKIEVLSRKAIQEYEFDYESKYGIISIRSRFSSPVTIPSFRGRIFTLFLVFDDLDDEFVAYDLATKEYVTLYPMSTDEAFNVISCLEKYKDMISHLLVQCDAGISRSAGVAAALGKLYLGDDSFVFKNKKHVPNKHCYIRVMEAYNDYHSNLRS